jgi:uridine phosphorylase
MKEKDRLYHLGFGRNDFEPNESTWVLLSGDPSRAERIAKAYLKKSRLLSSHRGLLFFEAETESGKKVLSATSGMGASSTSIIVNELSQLGLKKMIRVGTTGALQDRIQLADVVISQGSLCRQGAADDIAPKEFPAAADPFLTLQLRSAAIELKIPFHVGVTASVDTFYEGQERESSAHPALLRRHRGMIEEYRSLGVLNFEMESGVFFKMGLVYGFQAACVCGVLAKRSRSENVEEKVANLAEQRAIEVAIKAIEISS